MKGILLALLFSANAFAQSVPRCDNRPVVLPEDMQGTWTSVTRVPEIAGLDSSQVTLDANGWTSAQPKPLHLSPTQELPTCFYEQVVPSPNGYLYEFIVEGKARFFGYPKVVDTYSFSRTGDKYFVHVKREYMTLMAYKKEHSEWIEASVQSN